MARPLVRKFELAKATSTHILQLFGSHKNAFRCLKPELSFSAFYRTMTQEKSTEEHVNEICNQWARWQEKFLGSRLIGRRRDWTV